MGSNGFLSSLYIDCCEFNPLMLNFVSFTFTLTLAELPGFYFDPEKNRYFRLLPGHNNCNPLTREMLEKKEREKKRTKLLAEDERTRKVSVGALWMWRLCCAEVSVCVCVELKRLCDPAQKAPRTGLNSTLLLQRRRLGELPPSSCCRYVTPSGSNSTLHTLVLPSRFDEYSHIARSIQYSFFSPVTVH